MPDDQNILELDLSDGTRFTLRGWRAVEAWNKRLQDAWAWIRDGNGVRDDWGIVGSASNMLDQVTNAIRGSKDRNEPPSAIKDTIQNLWRKAWAPLHPDSLNGQRVLDIKEQVGREAGLFALGVAKNQLTINAAATLDHVRGGMMFVFPSLAAGDAIAERIARERRNMKAQVRSMIEALEAAEADREHAFERFLGDAAERGLASAKRRSERHVRLARKWGEAAQASIDRIEHVAATYNTFMTLKAPVEYWKKKSADHKTSEKSMFWWTVRYFGGALMVISILFAGVGVYLVNLDKDSVHPSIFFVASAGLGSVVALILWAGRLITKIYLSEQHLRQDAYERETMTQTFMALVAEKVASDDDKQIVLNALFRPTSDGIVKEEGGLDPSIASALAKFLAKP